VGENRILVHNGLKALKLGARPGMRALLEVAGVDVSRVDAGDLGYQLGPRVNAAGRLGDAMKGVELLQSSGAQAKNLAALLDAENQARRAIEKEIVAAAIAQIEASPALKNAKATVVGDERWHPGVVGIVASRLVDRYARPAIVVGSGGRGSARSIEAYHLYDALARVAADLGGVGGDDNQVVRGFGGHAHAAGVRIADGGFDRFRDAVMRDAEASLNAEDLFRTNFHDGVISGDDLRFDAVKGISVAAPFGRKNPEPAFVLEGVTLRNIKVLKGEHLKGSIDPRSFGADGHRAVGFIDVIAFGAAPRASEWEGPVDLLAVPDLNSFNGTTSVQLRVRDFKRSGSS
jgi:single-stranded-DNA-specific exonuclease